MQHWWNGFPWRVVQSNFCETDTRDFDPDAFLRVVDALHANAVVLNAGGILASYPTKLDDQPRSAYLQNYDLRQLVLRCRQKGLKTIARMDFSKMRREIFERHPDWAYRLENDAVIDYNGYIHTCAATAYQSDYVYRVLEEALGDIPFDGVYCNMGSFAPVTLDYSYHVYGPCRCQACRDGFFNRFHMEIPQTLRAGDPASEAFSQYQREVFAAQKKQMTAFLHAIRPDIAYCSVDYVRQEANSEFGRGPFWQYAASDNARALRGMTQEAVGCDTDMMGFFHRYVSVTPALQELRLWQSLANFAGLDYYVFGRLDTREDTSAYARAAKVFSFAERNQALLCGAVSTAEVLLVKEAYQYPNSEERGWIRALTEGHIPFNETLSGGLSKADLAKYRLVVLPDKGRLGPQAVEKLRAFAENGGVLLAAGSLPRGLEDVFSTEQGARDDALMGAVVRMRDCDRASFRSFTDRVLVPVGKSYWRRSYSDAALLGVLEPPQPFGPPEACYPHTPPTDYPAAAVHRFGKGRAVSVPWLAGACYYEEGLDIWALFLQDVLRLGGAVSVAGRLSPMVEVTCGQKGGVTLVQLVNGTGHFGKSYFDPEPLYEQSVVLPWEKETAVCRCLEQPEDAVAWTVSGGKLTVTLRKLGSYVCIAIE